MGRKPKPTALKKLQGNPGHRSLNKKEPKFSGVPSCPPELDDRAKREWARVSKELIAHGLLTTVDRAALAGYCVAYSRWIEAEGHVRTQGLVITSPNGCQMQSPYVGIANRSWDHMRRFMAEFGMTPASRTRLQVDTNPSDDQLDDFMDEFDDGATPVN